MMGFSNVYFLLTVEEKYRETTCEFLFWSASDVSYIVINNKIAIISNNYSRAAIGN